MGYILMIIRWMIIICPQQNDNKHGGHIPNFQKRPDPLFVSQLFIVHGSIRIKPSFLRFFLMLESPANIIKPP